LAIAPSWAQAAHARDADDIDAIFARYAGDKVPGCVVGVARDGATIVERAYGMADIEKGVPAHPDGIYEAGSISKQFTAAAVMLLVRDGRLSLTDDIRKYLPEMPDYGTPITIEQLIHHISGLRDWGSIVAMEGWPRNSRNMNNNDVLAIASRQRHLNYAPGAHYSYSNTNFNLAAIIVARVSGKSFADFTGERIFAPLGMTSTRWRERYREVVPGRATAYAREADGYVIDQPIEDAHGNGGLLTTVKDLLTWNAALDAGRLGSDFREAMERVGNLSDGTRIGYAAGLRIADFRGIREVAHWGATGGYRAWLARYPSQRLSVAMLCNASDANPVETGRRIGQLFLSGLKPTPDYMPTGRLPDGLYVDDISGSPVRIATDPDGRLVADGAKLTPAGPGRWTMLGPDIGSEVNYVFARDGSLMVEANSERIRYRLVVPVTSVDPTPYAGRYCGVDNPFCLIVKRTTAGGLSIATTGRAGLAPQPLRPVLADTFETASHDVIRFLRDRSGGIGALNYGDSRTFAVTFTRSE